MNSNSGYCNPRDTVTCLWDTPYVPDCYPGITPCLIKDGPPVGQATRRWAAAFDEFSVHGEAPEPVPTMQDQYLAAYPDLSLWSQNQALSPVHEDSPTARHTSSATRARAPAKTRAKAAVPRTANSKKPQTEAPASRSHRSMLKSETDFKLDSLYRVPFEQQSTIASTSHFALTSDISSPSLASYGIASSSKRKREVESAESDEDVVRAPKRSKGVKAESPSPSLLSFNGVRGLRPRAGKPDYAEDRDGGSQSAGSSYSPGPGSDRATSVFSDSDAGVAEAKTRRKAPFSARQNPTSSRKASKSQSQHRCDCCSPRKRFVRKADMRRHQNPDTPVPCPNCHRMLSRDDALKRHLRSETACPNK
ncbi:hypothetical protein B0H16DRAFT_313910 [Mycena metata]|uniref:C2H2-type domain-containing protein n=1 Tax=Mycena metata TaxID=1033252 RepID=A0AAD7NNC7_9AGAR|nr:hypothetical protein B0H16DRAFT_313910 [Mycena metata]